MIDIHSDVASWLDQGRRIALAMVIRTWGSSPRGPGAKMAVNELGEMTGSVSGGCVEGAVIETALDVLRSGKPRSLHFGVADETAWEVGLACGGEIDVFVHLLDEDMFRQQAEAMASGRAFATLTRLTEQPDDFVQALYVEGPDVKWPSLPGISGAAAQRATEMFAQGKTGLLGVESPAGDPVRYFLDVQQPRPALVIVGGAHISIALVRLAKAMGYRTVVVDPRRAFSSAARFPEADQLVHAWPDEALQTLDLNRSTAVAVLSHDPKLDDPALIAALGTDAFYIGALGSRTTQEKRRQRLQAAGLSESQLARIHGPIGLDLGGRAPEEIALSVMAEIVQARNRS